MDAHESARAAEVLDVPPDFDTEIARLLSLSRAEHLQKKHAAGRADKSGRVTSPPNYPKAEDHIRQAICYREEAEALDPDHRSPAWIADQAANRGQSSATMLEWFRHYLTIP